MSKNEWEALARWWRRRAELHQANGKDDRAKIAADRAATCERFAADSRR